MPNPLWNALDAELRAAHAEVVRLSARYGLEALTNVEATRRTMRGFKIALAPQSRPLFAALQRCVDLKNRRAKVPHRVPVQQVFDGQVIKLDVERKHLTNLIKMVAYQAESDLVRILAPYYSRADDEGRTLLHSALASAADIVVADTELRITLAPLSSPHRSRAISALCDELNRTAVCFPGTKLRLLFAVQVPPADAR